LIVLAAKGGELSQVLPTLGVFVFAGQRLLPTLNQAQGTYDQLFDTSKEVRRMAARDRLRLFKKI